MAIDLGDGVVVIRGDTASLQASLNTLKRSAGVAAAAVGAAIVGGFGIAIKTAADFEQAITNVASVTGAVGADFEVAREKIGALSEELGRKTVFSARESAKALEDLARLGVDVATLSFEDMVPIMNLANATQVDLGEAAKLTKQTMNAFGMEFSDTAKIADIFTFATSQSALNMGSLADGLKFVQPVAQSMGLSLETTVSIMAKLSDVAIEGSTAGTGLRRVLATLATPSKALGTVLGELGLNMQDVNTAATPLPEVLQLLVNKGLTASDVMKLFGQRAGPAVLAMTGLKLSAVDVGVALEEMGPQLLETFGPVAGLRERMSGLGLELGEVADKSKSANAIFGAIKASGLTAAQSVQLFGEEMGPLIFSLTNMKEGTSEAIDGIKEFEDGLNSAGGIAQKVSEQNLDTLNGAIKLLQSAMEGLSIAVGLLFTGDLQKGAEGLATFLNGVTEWIKQNKTLATWIARLTLALGFLIGAAGTFSLTILPIITALKIWKTQTILTTAAQSAQTTATTAGTVANKGLLATMAGPAGLLAVGAVAITATKVLTNRIQDRADATTDATIANANEVAQLLSLIGVMEDAGLVTDDIVAKKITDAEKTVLLTKRLNEFNREQRNTARTASESTGIMSAEYQAFLVELDRNTAEAQNLLDRYSLSHTESPSVLDRASWALEDLVSMNQRAIFSISDMLSGLLSQAANVWGQLANFFGGGGGGGGGLPAFAGGGVITSNAALVGERNNGAELITGAKGARVFSAQDTEQMLGGGGGGVTMHNTFNVDPGGMSIERVAQALGDRTLEAMRQRGIPQVEAVG